MGKNKNHSMKTFNFNAIKNEIQMDNKTFK